VARDLSNVGDVSSATPTPFLWAGAHQYQADYESGLYLLGNRYYDPSIGRFISQDPAGETGLRRLLRAALRAGARLRGSTSARCRWQVSRSIWPIFPYGRTNGEAIRHRAAFSILALRD